MRSPDWAVPTLTPSDPPLQATVRVPGSKSITNRAFLLAALTDTGTRVRHPLDSRDARLMLGALSALGARSERVEDGVLVHPRRNGEPEVTVELGNAGTVARFVPPVAAIGTQRVRFDGDEALYRRPIAPLLAALRKLGATIDGDGLPFTVHGSGGLRGGHVELDSSASSQFLSALLLSALFAFLAGGIILNVLKEELPEDRQSRFSAFALGAIAYAAVLLLTA